MLLLEKLPGSLAREAGVGDLFSRQGAAFSYAIGGLPFMSAANIENPIIRETAPVRKDQVDQQLLPGEQSLENWWLRSQQSFHGGAGQVFADPTQDNPFNAIRFRTSRNVDVWTQGEVTLLNNTVALSVAGLVDATEFTFGVGVHAVAAVNGTHVHFFLPSSQVAYEFTDSEQPLQSITSNGTHLFVVTLDGVFSTPIPASPAETPTWTQEYDLDDNEDPAFIAFVKSRLILAVGPSVYELVPHPDTPPATLPAAHFTHANPSWRWTGITETAAAILVIGNAGGVRGSVLKLTTDQDGDIPVLAAPAIAVQLPFGEVPYSAIGYLGRFVGIGTNKGVRIGVSDANGDIEYGPLIFETTSPVKAWAARDRFLWCTVSRGNEGDSGLYRIDLSLELASLRFPYATDLVADGDAGDCNVVAHFGASDRILFATDETTYREMLSQRAPIGTLQTSRIRYNTVEPKVYKLVRVRTPSLDAPLAMETIDQADNIAGSHIFPAGRSAGSADVLITSPRGPLDFMSLRFTFNRVGAANAPVLWAYQLKALPGSPRQRMIQLPLWCFDWEIDRFGQRRGGQGSAWRRLRALEQVDRAGDTVVLQDFDIGENVECVIERVRFEQTAPPPKFEGWGGVITVTLRTVR